MEGAVRSASVRGDGRSVGDHGLGQRHRQEGRLHGAVSPSLDAARRRGNEIKLRCWPCLPSSCQLDLSTLAKEQTHHLELPLEESRGCVVLLVTLTASAHVSIADLSVTPLDDPQERREILKRYVSRLQQTTSVEDPGPPNCSCFQGLLKSLSNLKDVGVVQVKVMRAEGLMAADVTGNQTVAGLDEAAGG